MASGGEAGGEGGALKIDFLIIPRSRQYPKILWIDDAKVVLAERGGLCPPGRKSSKIKRF
jgi:hypothetical protein